MAVALAVILLGSISMTAASTQPVREYLSRRQMRTFGEPSQLLGSDKDLVLLLVSEHMWRKDNWRCIKSKWVCTETANVSFTRDDHFWIPPHRTSNGTSEKKPGKLRFQYDVIRKPGEYTKVNTTYITESGNYSYGEYPVHFADDVCMVIAFPRRASYIFKRPRCALWVVNTTLESPNKYRHCMYILFATCKTPIYNLYEYEKEDCDSWGEPPEPTYVLASTEANKC
ncbi:uncharacterized protein LOC119452947 isoform X1 [Dermacentor silvarum]|uniref:uncharacterized protein LOC119452947 isoform X1 n=1 Tax=Dermacentor silvarum TaxID=543639 RepID=UPI002100C73D|nr:uncharacterized protein LOC119452947 isoform X1 [Dermacentor silvarum]